MANLYDIVATAQNGRAMDEFTHEFGLTSEQTEAAVAALLPAISMGLKRATATPDGLGDMLGLMGGQPVLQAMYADPGIAFSPQGREAGNQVLSAMFGTPDASRAIADQAQQFSGVASSILKKLLPILVGIIISGLMRSRPGQASPPPPAEEGGGLIDILRQIFQQQGPDSAPEAPSTVPPIGDLLRPKDGAPESSSADQPVDAPVEQPAPVPAEPPTQTTPEGDLLGQILRELEKGIREGRIKPVVVGPYEVEIPGQGAPAGPGQQQTPGADIFGQILRDLLGGTGGPAKGQPPALLDDAGAAVFGERLEAGRDLDQSQLDSLQEVFERLVAGRRR